MSNDRIDLMKPEKGLDEKAELIPVQVFFNSTKLPTEQKLVTRRTNVDVRGVVKLTKGLGLKGSGSRENLGSKGNLGSSKANLVGSKGNLVGSKNNLAGSKNNLGSKQQLNQAEASPAQ